MTVLWGVLSGVLVILVGQIPVRFVLDPLYEQRVAIRSVNDVLMRYADAISNPGVTQREYMDEASRTIREAACALQAKTDAVPLYGFFARLRLVRMRKDVQCAHGGLIGISNSIHTDAGGYSADRVRTVRAALKIRDHLSS